MLRLGDADVDDLKVIGNLLSSIADGWTVIRN